MVEARGDTALDAARRRFQESLPKKAAELRASALLLAGEPTSAAGREELLKRLRALGASAVVFREDATADRCNQLVARFEASRSRGVEVSEEDIRLVLLAARDFGGGRSDPPRPSPTGDARGGSAAPPSDTSVLRTTGDATGRPPERRLPGGGAHIVLGVLLVGRDAQRLAASLPSDRFEVVTAEADAAAATARVAAPDVVVVGDDVTGEPLASLVRALRSDPHTDLTALLAVQTGMSADVRKARDVGFDDAIASRSRPDEFAAKLVRLSGLEPDAHDAELGVCTVAEVANRMAREFERGIVEAVEVGGDERVPFGDGTDLRAAVWSAVARVRSAVVERSAGKVRFRLDERRSGRRFVAVSDADVAHAVPGPEVSLAGRRVLVAEDDPAVLWFFAGLLREAGADVLEAPDGVVALDLARRSTPDLVVTDILMPRLDGLSLARAMRRDPLLAEVPVVFLSWKDDYLQRMRELRAGGVGYLRKEETATVILDRVRDALRPRARFEARLAESGEVRGRIEGLGVLALVRSVGRVRGDARVTVRDVQGQFELEVRGHRVAELVRTAADGSTLRGRAALAALLGVPAGRFAVMAASGTSRGTHDPIDGTTFEQVARRLGAVCDAVGGKNLALADHVELDQEVLGPLLAISPPGLVEVARRLNENPSPRRWLLSGELEPEVLAESMSELARRGCVLVVRGEHGEDLVQRALDARLAGSEEAPLERPEEDPDPEPIDESQLEELVSREEAAIATRPRAHVVMPLDPVLTPAVVPVLAPRPDVTERVRVQRPSAVELAEPRGRGLLVGVLLLLLVLALLGAYLSVPRTATGETGLEGDTADAAPAPAVGSVTTADAAVALPTSAGDESLVGRGVALADLGLAPRDGQGGLGVDAPAGAAVRVDGVTRTEHPIRIAVAPGVHKVEVMIGDDIRIRFVPVAAGAGRLLRVD